MLQCGRIYKDAEIWTCAKPHQARALLQCGRIYKDAEIREWVNAYEGDIEASMWPHL